MLNSPKSKLAAVGVVGVLGAFAFGGIAYAVGGDEPSRSEYVTVVDTPGTAATEAPRDDSQPRGDKRDCPEKSGGQSESPSESPSATPSTPSEQQPEPGSAEDL